MGALSRAGLLVACSALCLAQYTTLCPGAKLTTTNPTFSIEYEQGIAGATHVVQFTISFQATAAVNYGAIGFRTAGAGMGGLDIYAFDTTAGSGVVDCATAAGNGKPQRDVAQSATVVSHTTGLLDTKVVFHVPVDSAGDFSFKNAFGSPMQVAWATGVGSPTDASWAQHGGDDRGRGIVTVTIDSCMTDAPDTDAPTPAPAPVAPTFTETCGPFPVVQGGAMTVSYWLGTSAGDPAVMIEAKFPKQVNGAPSWGAVGLRTSGFTGMKNLDSTTFDSTETTKVYNNILLRATVMPTLDLRAG
eukprot:Rhum_TRINITY_DN14561_c1_g1::Rhum_TRINITY_DN14561_c1_g1_i1::g.97288::m.97288